ncbi:hypothetical protein [Kiloniella sp.]|uniref:hypothetical protein n=1 Tax=Kiloniella sp. TaxID=1938587 RepID=UPI003B02DE5D
MARMYSSKTQIYWACKSFCDGRTLSHKTEIREMDGWRLAAIVHNLRKKYNWPIRGEYRGVNNIMHYWLYRDCQQTTLAFPRAAKDLKQELGL